MPTETSGYTILVADDEPTVRAYVRNILRAHGFRLIEASDGAEALELLAHESRPVDLVLTDVRMPRMDGVALARVITNSADPPPVVFMSGYAFDLEDAGLDRKSACGFVAKPFTRSALIGIIEKCLRPPGSAAGSPG